MGLCGSMLIAITGCGLAADSAEIDPPGDDAQDTEAFAPTPARGISIAEIEVNQGTRVAIGVGGDWIDETERRGYLVASRDSLLRVHYAVEPGWVPREIEARLTLEFPDGTSQSFTELRVIEADSARADLYGPFYFGLVADAGHTVAGTRYSVELWETEPGGEGLPERDWVNPVGGDRPIGFEPGPLQIKTVLVPITYQDSTANLDEPTTQLLIESLYEQNPASEIIYDVHEPVIYDGQLFDLVNLLPVVAELRGTESAEPNVYYHAFIDVGSSSLAGLHGISYIANDSEGDANSRVSATVLWSPNPSLAADTFTHETGHAQGLAHVECPVEAAVAPDPEYPHADGRIGNWGFGIQQAVLYDPDASYDYMSYCGPSWVSDWTWNKVFQRVQTLTAWDFEGQGGGGAPNLQELLVVAVSTDGTRRWWTMPGTIDPERVDGLERIEFEMRTGEVIEAFADVATLSDGRTRWIKALLPSRVDMLDMPDMSDIAEIRHVRGTDMASITPAAVRLDLHADRPSAWQPAWKLFEPSSRIDPSVRQR